MGVAGEKATEEVFRCTSGRCFGKKNPQSAPVTADSGDLTAIFIQRERSTQSRFANHSFGGVYGVNSGTGTSERWRWSRDVA